MDHVWEVCNFFELKKLTYNLLHEYGFAIKDDEKMRGFDPGKDQSPLWENFKAGG